jgi:hypothetical protein
MKKSVILYALAFELAFVSGSSAKQLETLVPNENLCREMHLVQYKIHSKTAIEEFIIAEIKANAKEYGVLDWGCMIGEFESQGDNATVKFYPNVVSLKGASVARFTLDRSGNLLAILMSMGPGNSNGIFTGIFNLSPSGEVAVIRRGGRPEWLNLELRQKP